MTDCKRPGECVMACNGRDKIRFQTIDTRERCLTCRREWVVTTAVAITARAIEYGPEVARLEVEPRRAVA